MAVRKFLSMRATLLAAGLIGAGGTMLILITAAANPGGFDYGPESFAYLSVVLAFYAVVALGSPFLSHSRIRRQSLAACTFVSFVIAVFGASPAGLIVYGLPTVILGWLAIRG